MRGNEKYSDRCYTHIHILGSLFDFFGSSVNHKYSSQKPRTNVNMHNLSYVNHSSLSKNEWKPKFVLTLFALSICSFLSSWWVIDWHQCEFINSKWIRNEWIIFNSISVIWIFNKLDASVYDVCYFALLFHLLFDKMYSRIKWKAKLTLLYVCHSAQNVDDRYTWCHHLMAMPVCNYT